MSANFADNSLHWLKGELNLTIGRVQASLETYLEDPEELAELREAVGHIDQLRGALIMMDLTEGTALAEEMCYTARALCEAGIEDEEAAGGGLMRAALWFPGYLEALERGQAARVPDLEAITRELRAVRNGEQPAAERSEPVSRDAFNLRLVREIRPGFQRSLIALMRGNEVDGSYACLAGTLSNLQGLAGTEQGYRVWWIAGRLVEALQRGSIALAPEQLRLLGAIDRAIKALIDDGPPFVENPEVEAIPQRIESMLAGTDAAARLEDDSDYDPPAVDSSLDHVPGLDHETVGQIATLLRETLALAQDGIDRLARGDETGGAQLPDIVKRLEAAFGVLTMVNLDVLASMVREQKEALSACSEHDAPPAASQLEQLARKLVLIEDGLDVVAQPLTAQQVISDARQREGAEGAETPNTVEGSRQALARFEVVRESLEDIAKIRELATKCCWNESGDESWSKLSPLVHGLSNVLTVLELDPGAETVKQIERVVADPSLSTLAQGDSPATNALAEALVGIEYYIEGETSVGHPHEQGLEHAKRRLERLESLLAGSDGLPVDAASMGVETECESETASATPIEPQSESSANADDTVVDEDFGRSDALESEAIENGEDSASDQAAENAVHTFDDLDHDALEGCTIEVDPTVAVEDRTVDFEGDIPTLGDDSGEPTTLEDLATSTSSEIDTECVEPAVDVLEEPVALDAGASTPAWSSHEFLDVFLEEAEGEVENLRQAIPEWEKDPADFESLQQIRRSYHTLKGSGRMVGADKAGELGWALEDVLNRVLDGRLAPSSGVIGLARDATDLVAQLVGHMRVGDDAVDIEPMLAWAKSIEESSGATAHEAFTLDSDLGTDEQGASTGDDASISEVTSTAGEQEASTDDLPASATGLIATETEVSTDLSTSNEEEFRETALCVLGEIEILLGACRDCEGSVDAVESVAQSFESFARSSAEAEIVDLAELSEAVGHFLRGQVYDERPLGTTSLEVVSEAVAECYRRLDGLRGPAGYVSRASEVLRRLRSLGDEPSAESTSQIGAGTSTNTAVDSDLDPELVEIFVQEAGDILDSTDVTLDRWGREPSNFDLLTDLRREMHTLKGSSRMAGFMVIGDLAHAMESLLDEISRGARTLTSHGRSLFQKSLDRLHAMLKVSRVMQQPEAADDLVAALQRCAAGEEPLSDAGPESPISKSAVSVSKRPDTDGEEQGAATTDADPAEQARVPAGDAVMLIADSSDMVRVSSELLDRLGDQMGESSIYRARIEKGVHAVAFNLGEMDQTVSRLSEKLRRLEIETEAQILFRYERGGASDFEEEFDPLELDRFSELQQLSRSLMEVVNDLSSIHGSLDDQTQELDTLLQEQGKVNREVQEGLMRTRMVRFDSIVPRMRRVVRQAADELEKRVNLVLEGGGEMERSLLDHVVAPLEHLLRNAVSHGIEIPELRAEAKKSEAGTIRLGVRREGSELVIEVSDDGAGIDFDKVRAKAERLGMISADQELTRDDLVNCLMQSGFSTADKLTQVAGRGVGMDVVRDAVAGFGGSLGIESESGAGTRILIRMPFSLSLAQALIVKASGETYAVPLAGIEAMTRLDPETVRNYLEKSRGSVEYGGEQYEIRSLGALFGNSPPDGELLEHHLPAVLVQGEDVRVALQVDQVIGSQEVIVKPVGTQVSSVPGISGATITADGSVVLILELGALVRNFVARRLDAEVLALHGSRQEAQDSELRIMVVDDSITMRKVTSRLIERHGMQATVAKDGLDASGLLEDDVPDAVILDIEMPRMDGFELAAHIRNQEHLWHLPIVMVTSRSGDKHRQRAMDLGVNAYLGKPYREEELLSAIRQVLGPRGERIAI